MSALDPLPPARLAELLVSAAARLSDPAPPGPVLVPMGVPIRGGRLHLGRLRGQLDPAVPVVVAVGFGSACWLGSEGAPAPGLGRLAYRVVTSVGGRGRAVLDRRVRTWLAVEDEASFEAVTVPAPNGGYWSCPSRTSPAAGRCSPDDPATARGAVPAGPPRTRLPRRTRPPPARCRGRGGTHRRHPRHRRPGRPGFALDVLTTGGPDTDAVVVGRVLDFLRTRAGTAPITISVSGGVTVAEAVARYEQGALALTAQGTQHTYRTWTRRLAATSATGTRPPSPRGT